MCDNVTMECSSYEVAQRTEWRARKEVQSERGYVDGTDVVTRGDCDPGEADIGSRSIKDGLRCQ